VHSLKNTREIRRARTLLRFRNCVIVVELHLVRNPSATASLLTEIERAGFPLRAISYDGQPTPTSADVILNQPDDHWTLWLRDSQLPLADNELN
jgi:hypothetical protein